MKIISCDTNPISTNSSHGNWVVYCTVMFDSKRVQSNYMKFFARKAEASRFVNDFKFNQKIGVSQ